MYLYETNPQYNYGYTYGYPDLQIPGYYNANFICPLYRHNFLEAISLPQE
jgi:hypothetical protein